MWLNRNLNEWFFELFNIVYLINSHQVHKIMVYEDMGQ